MSENAAHQLERAGWSEGRRVVIDAMVDSLHAAGYPVWTELTIFMAEFSNLVIDSADGSRSLWINPIDAVSFADPEWVADYTEYLGCGLAPIGGYSHMIIYLGRDGMLYGGFDAEFGPLGPSVQAMIDGLLNHAPTGKLSRVIR